MLRKAACSTASALQGTELLAAMLVALRLAVRLTVRLAVRRI